jgi:hypothetical protein
VKVLGYANMAIRRTNRREQRRLYLSRRRCFPENGSRREDCGPEIRLREPLAAPAAISFFRGVLIAVVMDWDEPETRLTQPRMPFDLRVLGFQRMDGLLLFSAKNPKMLNRLSQVNSPMENCLTEISAVWEG